MSAFRSASIYSMILIALPLAAFAAGRPDQEAAPLRVAAAALSPGSSGELHVDFTDGYLAVRAADADSGALFAAIAEKTGVRIVTDAPVQGRISIDFERKGFTRGMRMLVARLSPGEYEGEFTLARTFAESTYTIRKADPAAGVAKRENAGRLVAEGEALLRQGNDYEASHLFIQALADDPACLPAHRSLAEIYRRWGDWTRLIHRLEKMVKLQPDDPGLYRQLGDACRLDGRYETAVGHYGRFVGMSDNAGEIARVNGIMAELRAPEGAAFSRAISGARGLMQARDYRGAAGALKEAMRLDPRHMKPRELLAVLYEGGGEIAEAIPVRAEIARLDPENTQNLYFLGLDYCGVSDYEEGAKRLKEARDRSPNGYVRSTIDEALDRALRHEGPARRGE
jgi:tetratricopeptide (TPR) repeat protein